MGVTMTLDKHYVSQTSKRVFMITIIPTGINQRFIIGWRKYGWPGNNSFRGICYMRKKGR